MLQPFRPIAARLRAPLSSTLAAWLLALGLGAVAAPLTATAARADFRVCNGTQTLVGVAVGQRTAEGWVSEGWWRIPATTCRSVVEGELHSRYYYLYAEDSEGLGRWAGDIDMCIAENEFRIVGVKDCFARGFQKMGFREYDTGGQGSWMVQLTESPRGGNEQP
ncbi:DUF1036 domain-containing protein [Aureimonas pseudogalii]|uniref:Putative membrane protein n=1 Tax=Aureimonas pseudogalii TaxID=1744844 RepID=A0A7W6H3V4_9HYPH|nr:DUF1036 domain-containing protein [Aureimonas pseudogalii]MBB3997472.1 putative membrane protein [Aureimonas pseudogalii]